MREFIINPALPIIAKIKEDKKVFWIEYMQFVFAVAIALFVLFFIPTFSVVLAISLLHG